MRRVSDKLVAFALAVTSLWCAADTQAKPFHDLSFDEALAKAGREKKLVMVDFYTTWCPPCKMLDKSTWKDADVIKWLDEHTIALKIDAEKQRALARRYSIRAYPSMVFIAPDGKEQGRIVGFKPPREFLTAAKDVLAGVKPADRMRQELKKSGANDPMKRQDFGDELIREGKHQEALAEYLWCFDHGLEHSQAYFGVRLSFLLSSIHRLGREHPPALEALRQRRDAATQALLSGQGGFQQAMDMSAINRELRESKRTLNVYDKLRESGKLDDRLRIAMFRQVLDLLLEAKRYQDIIDAVGDVGAAVEQRIARFQLTVAMSKKDQSGAVDHQRRSTVQECAKYYEALLGTGRGDEATKLAERLTYFDSTGETVAALINHAIRAGAPDAARKLAQLGLTDLPEAEHDKVKAAAKEIP